MALSENVIRAAREHIRRNDNPGEVENAKRLLDKHGIAHKAVDPNLGRTRFGTGTNKNNYRQGTNQSHSFESIFDDEILNATFRDFFAGNKTGRKEPPLEHESKDYFFACDTAAEAIIAGRIFAHYNNGSAKTVDWDQKTKRFYMNNTTQLIANRTKESFITYRKGFKEVMLDNLDKIIKRNL